MISQLKLDSSIHNRRIKLDSHANTFILEQIFLLMNYTEHICNVIPYSNEYFLKKDIPIVQVAIEYTIVCGRRYILIGVNNI